LQRHLDSLTIDEYADLSRRDSPDMLFEVMGFGKPPATFDERRLAHPRDSFGPSLALLADAISMPLDEVRATGEVAVAPRDIEIAAGTLPAGSVAAQRVTVAGIRDGHELLRFRSHWYCTTDLEPAWSLQTTGWHVSVVGDVPMEVTIDLAIPLEQMAAMSPGITAHRAVNAVAAVCAAPPGIRTSVDLPQVIPTLN
jgi:hypothetical protein